MLVYWCTLLQFGRRQTNKKNEIEHIRCDVTTLCGYITEFINSVQASEKPYKLHVLIQILRELDLDEYGKTVLEDFAMNLLLKDTEWLSEKAMETLICLTSKSCPARFGQNIVNILQRICDKIPSIDAKIEELLKTVQNEEHQVNIHQLKTRVMELREEELQSMEHENYVRLNQIRLEIRVIHEQIFDTLRESGTINQDLHTDLNTYEMSTEDTIKCLQIYMFSCQSLQEGISYPEIMMFYKKFVYRKCLLKKWYPNSYTHRNSG